MRNKNYLYTLFVIGMSFMSSCSLDDKDGSSTLLNVVETSGDFSMSFAPVTNEEQRELSLKHLNDLNVNKIRFSEKWNLREPSEGNFLWRSLDKRIDFKNENKINVLITIEHIIPAWACLDGQTPCTANKTAFRTYVENIAKRYTNQINRIQFGNEWDLEEESTFVEYTELANIVYDVFKALSPDTKVVLGGVTRSVPIFIELCFKGQKLDLSQMQLKYDSETIQSETYKKFCVDERAVFDTKYIAFKKVLDETKYDIADIHLYDDAENWAAYIKNFKELITTPLLVSEFGGPDPVTEIYSDAYQATRVGKYLSVISSQDLVDAYYFKLLDSTESYHQKSGLIREVDLTLKPSYDVFKRASK